MRDWNKKEERDAAFAAVLGKARDNADLAKQLLDPYWCRSAFETHGEIKVPEDVKMQFLRQEDRPRLMVLQIPAATVTPDGEEPVEANFEKCFLCTYITYFVGLEQQKIRDISQLRELK